MAKGGKITRSDVADFNKIVQGFAEMEKAVTRNVDAVIKLNKESKKIEKALKGSGGFKQVADNSKKAADNVKKLTDSEKKLAAQTKKLAFALSEEGKQHAIATEKIRRQNAENRKFARSQLTAAKNTNTFGKAIGSFLFKANFLANVMSSLTSAVTRFARQAVRGAIKTVISFDSAMTNVLAISGATDEQFKDLKDSALELGGATKFTATQVAELQKEYAKLGFTTDQIIQLQESTLKLAAATGAELAPAAKVVGGALRAFGKDASQARSVAATLAIATTKSALAFEDYETILSTVAPVANAYNFSLEDTIALLGQLKNANFDSSKASTATRNILLNLADANGDLAQALGGSVNTLEDMVKGLVQLRKEGVDLNTTLELTDKRSVAAFNTFLNGADDVLVLKEAITDVNSELDKLVDTQLKSLENKILLLQSAWDGLILSQANYRNSSENAANATEELAKELNTLAEDPERTAKKIRLLIGPASILTNLFERLAGNTKDLTEEIIIQGGAYDEIQSKIAAAVAELEADNAAKEDAIRIAEEQKAIVKAEEERAAALKKGTEELIKNRRALKEWRDFAKGVSEELSDDDFLNLDFLDQDFGVDDDALETEIRKSLEFQTRLTSLWVKGIKDRSDAEREEANLKIDLAKQVFDFTSALNDRAFESQQAKANEELAALEDKFARELISQEQFESQKLEIEKRSQEESLKLRRRAALIDKAQALFNIALNTAVGASNAASKVVTLPLVPFIIAFGLAQAATVLAKPLPQFAKGTDSSPEGPAIVGEKGKELMVDPKGNVSLSPGKSSVMNLEKGTKIIPHDITENLLSPIGMLGGSMDNDKGIIAELQAQNSLLKQISKKPVASSTITPAGILTSVNKGSTTLKELRKYFS